ncbi:MAG: Gfo/Idh/MocA family oxidoreductase [Candidatus Bathyarchaeum tardum]|nr:MAG: Gfo/Idh/MocA family oxidoreductase [Candidatus Bathyarchaeum tardum]
MQKIGLGIIGLGYIGKLHMKHALKIPNAKLVAVSDLSKRALKDAKNIGVKKVLSDYEKLLKQPDVDAVAIALPTHLHLDCAIKAAEAGKHIFLEKPMAINLKDAKEIVNAARKNTVELMMGYPLRFNKVFNELKIKKDNGLLGDIEVAHATFISSGPFFHRTESHTPVPVPNWWFNRELTGGGVLIDLGSHIINLLRWYFGEINSIKSQLGYRFNLDLEDSAVCVAKFDSGTTGVITTGWFLQGYELNLDFFGTVDHGVANYKPGNRLVAATQLLTTGISDFHRPHYDELNYFVHCLMNGYSPLPSGEDGVKDMEAICKAYQNSINLD